MTKAFYIRIPAGTERRFLETDDPIAFDRDTLEYGRYVDNTTFETYTYWNDGYRRCEIDAAEVEIIPSLRIHAQRNFQAQILEQFNEQQFQKVVLNPPREIYNPLIVPYLSWEECLQSFPHLAWILADVLILSKSEAGCCIRDYRAGQQFSGEAVSHSGGTPLDAIVRSVESAGHRVGDTENLGAEIIQACFNVSTGTLDLERLERWCEVLKDEWDDIRKKEDRSK